MVAYQSIFLGFLGDGKSVDRTKAYTEATKYTKIVESWKFIFHLNGLYWTPLTTEPTARTEILCQNHGLSLSLFFKAKKTFSAVMGSSRNRIPVAW
jgi:hypothetical protein